VIANPPPGYPRVAPYLLYEDPAAALEWLSAAFGFRERFRNTLEDGRIDHAEMEIGEGLVMLASPGADYRSPRRLGGATALVHVYVDDIERHFERAKAGGAAIRNEPTEKPYGTIQYSAADPEGHLWLFSQQVREPDPEWRTAQASAG
jgi:PhnB protein